MLKHKRILKHRYIDPWNRTYENVYTPPDPYSLSSRERKAHTQAGALEWMVYWCIHGKFNLQKTINDYWRYSTKEEFPEEGSSADVLLTTIMKNLLITGHRKNQVNLLEGEEDYFPTMWIELWDKLKTIHINKEKEMGKKFKDPAELDVPEEKTNKAGKPLPKGEPGGPRMTAKRQASIRCFELLLEEKYTDQEIIDLVEEELEYKFIPSMIKRRRKMLNEGDAVDFGFEIPATFVEEVGGDSEGATTTTPATPRKPPLKPMKRKASAPPPAPASVAASVKKPLLKKTFKFISKKKA